MFERSSAVIKDAKKLSFEYVPGRLVHREEQMSLLETLFRPMITDGLSCSAFLHGGVGTGKTATAKRFCDDMLRHCAGAGKPIGLIFINCRIRNTEHGVLIHLLRYFDPGYPDRGFSVEEMLRSLKKHMDAGNRPYVIVLDEADVLLKGGTKDLMYQLTRFTDELRGSSVSLILISQEAVVEMLDTASLSGFRRANTIKFEKYTKDELKDIVLARSEEALIPNAMSLDVADLLADIGKGYGDARLVIEMLEKAASIAEERSDGNGTLNADDVRSANAMIYSNVSENKLASLDMKRRIALLAIARAIKGEPYVSITKAEKTYQVVSEEYGQVARKHTQFWTYVQDMERMNLLETMVKSEPDGGRTTYISLPDIPPKELANKLEYLLETPVSDDLVEF